MLGEDFEEGEEGLGGEGEDSTSEEGYNPEEEEESSWIEDLLKTFEVEDDGVVNTHTVDL